jgi:PAS domain S-box-containing protein
LSDREDEEAGEAALPLAPEEVLPLLTEADSGFALFTIDPSKVIDSWSPGVRSVFGWTGREVVGGSFERTFTPEDRVAGVPGKELKEAGRDGHAPDVRWHLRHDGSTVFIQGGQSLHGEASDSRQRRATCVPPLVSRRITS